MLLSTPSEKDLSRQNYNRTSANQIWIFWSWEAPINHPEYTQRGLNFNWTMTYRRDSDIWHAYALKLGTYYPIDQYGLCTEKRRLSKEEFEKILFNYKFYLAFENSYCLDYITEKVFYNALVHGGIPIVMGASESNYDELLPKSSFMYISHSSNFTEFGSELVRIGSDIDRYKTYHEWRTEYRVLTWPDGYYLDAKFCDLCTKLQQKTFQSKTYTNFSDWLNKCQEPSMSESEVENFLADLDSNRRLF
ncbi:unnamed protein product [Didymodactylos carnosus]|uniref:Fucosyltransferase n=1 Tax=Didymodactylos carnosus TaxID=1234261 RepID=A0A813P8F8_9BILA|nr:unnamed protein product [Didymodactylos carnosus]CAF0880668.1 unnamed protein product [Didymodactylos carnosus]CAF3523797.1 unnamed protein product [Didymodactylos carnosus]CAF3664366.1 unnamed protein product [Didymodactylos carnosus]